MKSLSLVTLITFTNNWRNYEFVQSEEFNHAQCFQSILTWTLRQAFVRVFLFSSISNVSPLSIKDLGWLLGNLAPFFVGHKSNVRTKNFTRPHPANCRSCDNSKWKKNCDFVEIDAAPSLKILSPRTVYIFDKKDVGSVQAYQQFAIALITLWGLFFGL